MAGAGYKLFNTGDVLTAAQVNTYLQEQTVMVFADASARTTALSGVLAEGMMSYLKDDNKVYKYDGSAWSEVGASTAFNPTFDQKSAGSYIRIPSLGSAGNYLAVEDVTHYGIVFLDGRTFDRISLRSGTTFSGTATVRLGIYNASTTTGKPTTVYLDAGTVSVTAASTTYEITINSTPPAGYYYLAFNCQVDSGGTNTYSYIQSGNILNQVYASLTSSTAQAMWEQTGVTGAFATAGTLTASLVCPTVGLRMA